MQKRVSKDILLLEITYDFWFDVVEHELIVLVPLKPRMAFHLESLPQVLLHIVQKQVKKMLLDVECLMWFQNERLN